MGLAVCRKIIEEHEGEISIQSKEGKGTEIIFILPVEMNEEFPEEHDSSMLE